MKATHPLELPVNGFCLIHIWDCRLDLTQLRVRRGEILELQFEKAGLRRCVIAIDAWVVRKEEEEVLS